MGDPRDSHGRASDTDGEWRSRRAWKEAARTRRDGAEAFIAHVRRSVHRLVEGDEPVIAGPWLGEVGYELLGWIPFLRRLVSEVPGLRSRLTVVSRGDTSSWYADLGVRYEEALLHFTPSELAELQASGGSPGHPLEMKKAFGPTVAQRHVAARVAASLGYSRHVLLDPSWFLAPLLILRAQGSLRRIEDLLDFRPITPPELPAGCSDLSAPFVAVRLYDSGVLPLSAAQRRNAQRIIDVLRETVRVVDLDPELPLDNHEQYRLEGIERLSSIVGDVPPAGNLGIQTAVLARASAFIGTFGGGAFLPPLLGVPTVAVYSQAVIVKNGSFFTASRLFDTAGYGPWFPFRLDPHGVAADAAARLVHDAASRRSLST